jgi:hypothetical protein
VLVQQVERVGQSSDRQDETGWQRKAAYADRERNGCNRAQAKAGDDKIGNDTAV